MPSASDNFLTRERLMDIGLGIGRGFQSYDPNNPFAGAGAAMEATIGSGMAREQRQQQREDALSAEQRAESRAERAAETAFERQKDLVNFRINAEGVAEEAQYQKSVRRRQEEIDMANAEREKAIAQGVFDIDKGRAEIDTMFGEAIGQAVPTIDQTPYYLKAEEPSGDGGEMSWMKGAWKGRITDESDFSMAAGGISNGDYAGMESFDLVRLKDGTPAIRVNGGVIPVAANEWMSLMTMRQKMRNDIDQRMRFAVNVRKAQTSIGKMSAAVPALRGPIADSMMMMAEIDPERAMELSMQAAQATAMGRGREFAANTLAEIQNARNENIVSMWTKSRGEIETPNPMAEMLLKSNPNADVSMFPPSKSKAPSIRDENISRLRGSSKPEDQITAMGWMNLESFLMPPQLKQMYPPDQKIGFIDYVFSDGRDMVSPMSPLTQVQHLAAYGNMGASVPIKNVPVVGDPAAMTVSELQAVKEYGDYLQAVDAWASSAFGWDTANGRGATPRETIDGVALLRVTAASQIAARDRQADQQKPNASTPATPAKKPSLTGSAL